MPENTGDRKIFSLLEVTKSIQKTLRDRYSSSYWIKAEMNKLNFYIHSGHCYPDLVEKSDGKVIAQIRANLWKDDYARINGNFITTLKEPLKDGIKILFLARINFDPIYGIALQIIDIDPSYTLGDLEKEKQETIQKLKDEGIFDKNKKLKLALLPQRIAIISVDTSKGYSDFLSVINSNSWGYRFFHFLFPSLLQGEKAVDDIVKQLTRIKRVVSHFDAVAIIRGGGGDVGLSCYNNLQLAREIAMFPLPVFTGIGHSTNETVAEMISYYNAITPTKLAEYLIQIFHNFSVPVQRAQESIIDKSRRLLFDQKNRFQSEVKLFRSETSSIINRNKNSVQTATRTISLHSHFILKNQLESTYTAQNLLQKGARKYVADEKNLISQNATTIKKDTSFLIRKFNSEILQSGQQIASGTKFIMLSSRKSQLLVEEKLNVGIMSSLRNRQLELSIAEKDVLNMSPQNVLKRGYSITLLKGKAITNFNQVSTGDMLNTILFEGSVESVVKTTNKSETNE